MWFQQSISYCTLNGSWASDLIIVHLLKKKGVIAYVWRHALLDSGYPAYIGMDRGCE